MKKFMFSAVALVAFSFAGMASTGGEEKLEVKEDLKKNIVTPCEDKAFDAFYAAVESGQTYAQANKVYADTHNACVKGNKKVISAE